MDGLPHDKDWGRLRDSLHPTLPIQLAEHSFKYFPVPPVFGYIYEAIVYPQPRVPAQELTKNLSGLGITTSGRSSGIFMPSVDCFSAATGPLSGISRVVDIRLSQGQTDEEAVSGTGTGEKGAEACVMAGVASNPCGNSRFQLPPRFSE